MPPNDTRRRTPPGGTNPIHLEEPMSRPHLTPATEPVGPDGFTLRERSWLSAAVKHVAELNDLLAERGSPRRLGVGPEQLPVSSPTGFWPAIGDLVAWLDETNGRSDHETAMRLMKLAEEAGEVMAAYIGVQGQNPRKGVTHKPEDVADELCDVIVTAAVALHLFSDDPAGHLGRKVGKIAARVGRTEAVSE